MSSSTVAVASPSINTTSTDDLHYSNESPTINIRDLLSRDTTTSSFDFYSPAVFDAMMNNVDEVDAVEEVFIRAQRAAFEALDDAALAKALMASEREAVEKERGRQWELTVRTGSTSTSSRRTVPVPIPDRYALVSPSELGQYRARSAFHSRTGSSSSSTSSASSSTSSSASSASSYTSTATSPPSSPPKNTAPYPVTTATTSNHRQSNTTITVAAKPASANSKVSIAPESGSGSSRSSQFYPPPHNYKSSPQSIPIPFPGSKPSSSRATVPSAPLASSSTLPRHPSPSTSLRSTTSTITAPVVPKAVPARTYTPGPSTSYSSSSARAMRPRSSNAAASASAREVAMGMMADSSAKTDRPIRKAPSYSPGRGKLMCSKCSYIISLDAGRDSQRTLDFTVPNCAFSELVLRGLHVSCPNCTASFCRGCLERVDASSSEYASKNLCGRSCQGGSGCNVKACCKDVCVVAIANCLGVFDAHLGKMRGALSSDAYLELMLSRSDRSTKGLEDVVSGLLDCVYVWLGLYRELTQSQPHPDNHHPHPYPLTNPDSAEYAGAPALHRRLSRLSCLPPTLPSSRTTSKRLAEDTLLPQILHVFLRNENVSDWIRFAGVYGRVLGVLRRLVEAGLGEVLEWTRKVQVQKAGASGLGSQVGARAVAETSVRMLVMRLETHTKSQLMECGNSIRFGGTREKVYRLCDGIMWLLLQDLTA
ncbi:hypothetical protein FA15DRAFT_658436 [Coprinopsis marcescibilis]|uniref:Uncharacterized protein n=1 Tax=Coprinopsis marcescibilis TaxID=230819 RepID=A0A5C3KLM3_COPMA|nr:hypothetical protein FA15DRAFT_658436 [Coprinopsis marcescibilis]